MNLHAYVYTLLFMCVCTSWEHAFAHGPVEIHARAQASMCVMCVKESLDQRLFRSSPSPTGLGIA